jgi:hypothetical protein
MSESQVVSDIFREFGARPDLRIWRQNTGAARTPGGRFVRFGIPGQADISGLRLPSGQRLEIECKVPAGGRQSKEQRQWQTIIERFGGLYVLARSVADVEAALVR